MRKLRQIGLALLLTLPFVATEAKASSDDAAFFIGGLLGGLVLGEVIQNNHNRHYRVYDDPYYDEPVPPRYHQQCWTKERVVWNQQIEDYDVVPYTVCR